MKGLKDNDKQSYIKQIIFYFFFQTINCCLCPIIFYIFLSLLEFVQNISIIGYIEQRHYKENTQWYIDSIMNVTMNYIVIFISWLGIDV